MSAANTNIATVSKHEMDDGETEMKITFKTSWPKAELLLTRALLDLQAEDISILPRGLYDEKRGA